MVATHIEKVWELLHDPHFVFLSHKDVSPLFGRGVSLFPGLVIDIIQDLVAGHGSNSAVGKTNMIVGAAHEPGGTSVVNAEHWELLIRGKDFADRNGTPYDLT